MSTLMPWILIGLTGIAVTAILAAAEWYIWDSRYRLAARFQAGSGAPAGRKDVIQVPSASGRDVVVTLAA